MSIRLLPTVTDVACMCIHAPSEIVVHDGRLAEILSSTGEGLENGATAREGGGGLQK